MTWNDSSTGGSSDIFSYSHWPTNEYQFVCSLVCTTLDRLLPAVRGILLPGALEPAGFGFLLLSAWLLTWARPRLAWEVTFLGLRLAWERTKARAAPFGRESPVSSMNWNPWESYRSANVKPHNYPGLKWEANLWCARDNHSRFCKGCVSCKFC